VFKKKPSAWQEVGPTPFDRWLTANIAEFLGRAFLPLFSKFFSFTSVTKYEPRSLYLKSCKERRTRGGKVKREGNRASQSDLRRIWGSYFPCVLCATAWCVAHFVRVFRCTTYLGSRRVCRARVRNDGDYDTNTRGARNRSLPSWYNFCFCCYSGFGRPLMSAVPVLFPRLLCASSERT